MTTQQRSKYANLDGALTYIIGKYRKGDLYRDYQRREKRVTFDEFVLLRRNEILEDNWDDIQRYFNKRDETLEDEKWIGNPSNANFGNNYFQDYALWDWRYYTHTQAMNRWWNDNKEWILRLIRRWMTNERGDSKKPPPSYVAPRYRGVSLVGDVRVKNIAKKPTPVVAAAKPKSAAVPLSTSSAPKRDGVRVKNINKSPIPVESPVVIVPAKKSTGNDVHVIYLDLDDEERPKPPKSTEDKINFRRQKEYLRALKEERNDKRTLQQEWNSHVRSEKDRMNIEFTNQQLRDDPYAVEEMQEHNRIRERVRKRGIRQQYLEQGRPEIVVPAELQGQAREDYINKQKEIYDHIEGRYGKYKKETHQLLFLDNEQSGKTNYKANY